MYFQPIFMKGTSVQSIHRHACQRDDCDWSRHRMIKFKYRLGILSTIYIYLCLWFTSIGPARLPRHHRISDSYRLMMMSNKDAEIKPFTLYNDILWQPKPRLLPHAKYPASPLNPNWTASPRSHCPGHKTRCRISDRPKNYWYIVDFWLSETYQAGRGTTFYI